MPQLVQQLVQQLAQQLVQLPEPLQRVRLGPPNPCWLTHLHHQQAKRQTLVPPGAPQPLQPPREVKEALMLTWLLQRLEQPPQLQHAPKQQRPFQL